MIRSVESVWRSAPTIEGAGVRLKRVFGQAEVPRLDPFLLLDDFSSTKPADYIAGFPWHPHRGIETVTYMVHGKVAHEDSIGNKGTIKSGEVQWMTAGSGIIHQEMPQRSDKLEGFQLWVNLPSGRKMMDPRYQGISRAEIQEIDLNGVKAKIICGSVNGVKGPVQDITVKPEYIDITMEAGSAFSHPVTKGHRAFAYVIGGKGLFDGKKIVYSSQLAAFTDGDSISVQAKEKMRFLLISGKPLNEPVAWYGPIVMNTQAELRKAFTEFNDGSFIKSRPAV